MMLPMRTTVTLEPDVAALVKKLMSERGLTFKQAVNDAIRKGLSGPRGVRSFPTFDMGEPIVNLDKALQLAATLEDEEIARKMTVGK